MTLCQERKNKQTFSDTKFEFVISPELRLVTGDLLQTMRSPNIGTTFQLVCLALTMAFQCSAERLNSASVRYNTVSSNYSDAFHLQGWTSSPPGHGTLDI